MKPTKRRIDPLEGIEARVDDVREVKTEGVNPFEELLRKYEDFLDPPDHLDRLSFVRREGGTIPEILSPQQINQFLHMTSAFETHPSYQKNTGLFLSRLIQNSYNAGNNNFYFDVTYLPPIDYLFTCVIGTEERKLIGTVIGTLRDNTATVSAYCHFTIENAKDCTGQDSLYSTYILGTAGSRTGSFSWYSVYHIQNSGTCIGDNSKNCTFFIENIDPKFPLGSNIQEGTIKIRNKETIDSLMKIEESFFRQPANKLIYINPQRVEEEVYRK